jgi:hypothetical protein
MKNKGTAVGRSDRKCSFLLGLAVLTCSLSLSARSESDSNACTGIDFDAKRPLIASKVATRPHVNFVKGSEDDAACPGEKEACRKKAFVVPGDVVLTGRTQGAFTCVAYQSFHARKQDWTTGWLPTSSLAPMAPMRSPNMSDWLGSWSHPGGTISISRGKNGTLSIEGEQTYPAAGGAHSGVLGAVVAPSQGVIAFVDDGTTPFEKAEDGQCLVRMQRVGAWLLVEDNMQCGGSMVTFTGLYRRE